MYLKDCFKSVIKSFGSSRPICNLTMCSFFLYLKNLLPWLYSSLLGFNSCKIARLSNPPQLYPMPKSSKELTNLITEDLFLDFITIDNKPVAPV